MDTHNSRDFTLTNGEFHEAGDSGQNQEAGFLNRERPDTEEEAELYQQRRCSVAPRLSAQSEALRSGSGERTTLRRYRL